MPHVCPAYTVVRVAAKPKPDAMPSILKGYEYDIFISYRKNDNNYDHWVSEFVTNLKLELEATVKDRLSIYFDENPEDGLLETHNVDKSLAGKLKSLIFIPIVSMTYCDPKSFAWQHEFIPFKNLASADAIGLDVKVANNNFSSRILPVRIHEIDQEDVRMLEKEMDGVLRSVDFIYQSAGVNRSLRPKDDDLQDNQNHSIYRNQINKVANAVKEIIAGIKGASFPSKSTESSTGTAALDRITASITASLPDTIRYKVLTTRPSTIYLAWTSSDLKPKREEMAIVLTKAGFNVVPNFDCPSDEKEFVAKSIQAIASADCSLHLLGTEFGRRFEEDEERSFPEHQYEEAKKRSAQEGSNFHTFIWFTPEPGKELKSAQAKLITNIRNGIVHNMTFSNSLGPMQLVDDIRSIMFRDIKEELNTKDTDIFFIFNQQDEQEAQAITDILSNEYPVETMNITPEGEEEYRELSKQQIPRSKLAVVYFRYAADWALPFIKQIWKQVGGASSTTPILLVGEDDPKSNIARTFKAPKVVSTIVAKNNVPTEIKRVYVKVLEL